MDKVERVGDGGHVDLGHYEFKAVAPPPKRPSHRTVQIRVPAGMPDALVQSMWTLGQTAQAMITRGAALFLFPQLVDGEGGQQVPSFGNVAMQVDRPEDVHRVIALIMTINQINGRVEQDRQGGAADVMTAALMGERAKDAALDEAKREASGKPKIHIVGGKS